MAGAGSGEGNISNRGSTTIADRTSTFLLARPTLVDVLPSPTINRPQTASGTPARSSSMWHDGAGGITDYSPMQRTPDFAAMHRSQFDMNAHSKTMSGDSGRRFSLFPRPQTATGGERPLSLAPSPGAALRKEVTGSTLRTEITTAMPSKKTKEKHELREKHELKEKSTKGFIQFSAFFKATFRFGKSRKDDRARSASVATALS